MKAEKEFKVIIKKNGHIFYNGQLIGILAQWNRFEDLEPETLLIKKIDRRKKINKKKESMI